MQTAATLSPCETYRYSLSRTWHGEGKRVNFVLLNPSTADAEKDDPTIRRCIGFAQSLGFGSLVVTNLFAYRSTCPDVLKQTGKTEGLAHIIGPENTAHLAETARTASAICLGWGNHGAYAPQHVQQVLSILQQAHTGPLFCLGKSKDGHPKHPLYLPKTSVLLPF